MDNSKENPKKSGLRIVLAAGGTGGPIMPLLAVAQVLRAENPGHEFLVIGSRGGVEEKAAAENQMQFAAIPAGKLRRYFSLKNLAAPFQVFFGAYRARAILKNFQADVVCSAGGYAAVPVGIAARFLGIPVFAHQQDARVSLSNQLLAPFAAAITVAFEQSLASFPGRNPQWIGNPVRPSVLRQFSAAERQAAFEKFSLSPTRPVILVMGGGTGALGINQIVHDSLSQLLQLAQVIHITGSGKSSNDSAAGYFQTESMADIAPAYQLADAVVSRAGMSSLAELAALGKAMVLIPMPSSHQADNAMILQETGAAAVLEQAQLQSHPEIFINSVRDVLGDPQLRQGRAENAKKLLPSGAAERLASRIKSICQTR